MKRILWLMLVVSVGCAGTSIAAERLPVTIMSADGDGADTTIEYYSTGRNNNYGDRDYGMLTTVGVGYDRNIILRFDLAAWTSSYSVHDIEEATLRIYYYAQQGTTPVTNMVTVGGLANGSNQEGRPGPAVADGWNEVTNAVYAEAGITWNNQPSGAYANVGTFEYTNGVYGWCEFSTEELVSFLKTDTNDVVTIRLSKTGANNDKFYTKEHSSGLYKPELILTPKPKGKTIAIGDGDGADTTVELHGARDSNFGSRDFGVLTPVGVGYDRNIILRFDLAAWTSSYSVHDIEEATLRIYYYYQQGTTTVTNMVTVGGLENGSNQEGRPGPDAADGWNEVTNAVYAEAGITWNNQPSGSYENVGTFEYTNGVYGWYEFSTDELVSFLKTDTNDVVTIRLSKTGANNDKFYTKEYNSGWYESELVLIPALRGTLILIR